MTQLSNWTNQTFCHGILYYEKMSYENKHCIRFGLSFHLLPAKTFDTGIISFAFLKFCMAWEPQETKGL